MTKSNHTQSVCPNDAAQAKETNIGMEANWDSGHL